jgi:hypothetical protein
MTSKPRCDFLFTPGSWLLVVIGIALWRSPGLVIAQRPVLDQLTKAQRSRATHKRSSSRTSSPTRHMITNLAPGRTVLTNTPTRAVQETGRLSGADGSIVTGTPWPTMPPRSRPGSVPQMDDAQRGVSTDRPLGRRSRHLVGRHRLPSFHGYQDPELVKRDTDPAYGPAHRQQLHGHAPGPARGRRHLHERRSRAAGKPNP